MKKLSYKGKTVVPYIDMYAENYNIYMGFKLMDKGSLSPYCDVTVNLVDFAPLIGCIDINNEPKIFDFLIKNGFCEDLKQKKYSGFAEYPVVVFNKEKMLEIDRYMIIRHLYCKEEDIFGFDIEETFEKVRAMSNEELDNWFASSRYA